MASLYADEDFSLPVVENLRQLGHDVLTAQDAGQAGQGVSDASVLAFATSQQRAVLTFNRRHFIRLHQQGVPHFGIIVCTRDVNVVALAHRINHAIAGIGDLENQLFRVNRPRLP
jgi:hypothetical protein